MPILIVSCAVAPVAAAATRPAARAALVIPVLNMSRSSGLIGAEAPVRGPGIPRYGCDPRRPCCRLEARFHDPPVAFHLRGTSHDWADRIGRCIRLRDLHIVLA